MKLSDRENDLKEGLTGIAKLGLSLIPILGQTISGAFAYYDSYKRSTYDRNLRNSIKDLEDKVDDLNKLFEAEWLKTEEGRIFVTKIFDSILDSQIEEKQKIFINALINGIEKEDINDLEKFKFVDMIRQLSNLSLMVLADIHEIAQKKLNTTTKSFQIMPDQISAELGNKYGDPYAVLSAIEELKGQGLFSNISSFKKGINEQWRAGGSISDKNLYTEYTCKFVEFITYISK